MINNYKKGFTAVEILIVIIALSIIMIVILPQFSTMRGNQVFKSAVSDILSSLNKAQSQTLASVDSLSYGVHFQSDKVIIFRGTVFSNADVTNEIVEITSPAFISNVTLGGVSGFTGDVYYNRLSGSPNNSGVITVSNSSLTKIITIPVSGSASVN